MRRSAPVSGQALLLLISEPFEGRCLEARSMTMDADARILAFLSFNQNQDVCDRCLASGARITLPEATAVALRLSRSPAFLRDRWLCSQCRTRCTVTRALPNRVVALRGSLETRVRRRVG